MNSSQKSLNIVKKMTNKQIVNDIKKINKLAKKISVLMEQVSINKNLHEVLTNEIHRAYAKLHENNEKTKNNVINLNVELPQIIKDKVLTDEQYRKSKNKADYLFEQELPKMEACQK